MSLSHLKGSRGRGGEGEGWGGGRSPGPGAPIGRAGGWSLRVLARVLAGAGGKLGARVARVRRLRLCWELFQCGRLRVGGRGVNEYLIFETSKRSVSRIINTATVKNLRE